MNWVKATRPMNGVLLIALTILGFRLAGHNALEGLPYALAVFIIYSATIVWNDYCDRNIDNKKGRTFAHDNAEKYLAYSIVWWTASILSACWVWRIGGGRGGTLMLALIAVGLLYTEAEKNAFTKNGTVALWLSTPLLFPLTRDISVPMTTWWLFVSLALINYGREILKDVEDKEYDGSTKGTLAKLLGPRMAIACASCLLLLGVSVAIIGGLHIAGCVIAPFCIYGAALALRGKHTTSVQVLKLGMVLFLAALFL